MSQGKEIRSKISSIQSTQKITRAMEMVAASKMRKAQQQMQRSRPYSEKIRQVLAHASSANPEYRHPFATKRSTERGVGYLIVSSDRGLCGGLNHQLFKQVLGHLPESSSVCFATLGRRAGQFFSRLPGELLARADGLGDVIHLEALIGVMKVMLDAYLDEKIDVVYVCSNRFVNTMVQKPVIEPLLPLSALEENQEDSQLPWDYLYEPEAKVLLDKLIWRYLESQVYQAVVENVACEQAARMVAMKSATENAGNLIDELKLSYNKARQAAITKELSEIVSGAQAVE